MAFIFGGDTKLTYEEMQRQRALAEALGIRSAGEEATWGGGLAALGQGIGAMRAGKQADAAQTAGRENAGNVLSSLLLRSFGGGQQQAAPQGQSYQAPPMNPNDPAQIGRDAMAAIGKGPGGVDFAAVEAQYGLPAGYLGQTAQIESSMNPNAQNPNSSAGGLFQFIDSTAADYGLANKFDPAASTDAAARLAADNAAQLRRVLGREPTPGELYLAHQQGGGGASALLRNPQARAVDVVGADAVRLNGGNMDMSSGEFASLWTGKMDRMAQPQGGVTLSTRGGPQQTMGGTMGQVRGDPTQNMPGQMGGVQGNPMQTMQGIDPALVQALSDPYMDATQKSVLAGLLQQQIQGMQPQTPVAGTQVGDALVNPVTGEVMYQAPQEAPQGTDDMREYDLYRQQTEASGSQPMSFQEYMTAPQGQQEYGLQPVYGTDANGNLVVMQMGKDGRAVATSLPDGVTPNLGIAAQERAQGAKIGEAAGEKVANAPTVVANADIAFQGIKEILEHPGIEDNTGFWAMGNFVPGTQGYAFQKRVEQLAGGAFLTAIQQLQGMGALSNAEGSTATAALARLDTGLGQDEFKDALADYQAIVQAGVDRAKAAIEGGAPAQVAPAATGQADFVFDPATGTMKAVGQ